MFSRDGNIKVHPQPIFLIDFQSDQGSQFDIGVFCSLFFSFDGINTQDTRYWTEFNDSSDESNDSRSKKDNHSPGWHN